MTEEHPFAQYIRILGKGKKGSRALTQEESQIVMKMILEEEVTREQLGAFLMLMRVKEETAEEVAGFVQAIKDHIQVPDKAPHVDLDWSSYAGKRRQLPWFLLATLALAETGVSIFMHGASGHTAGRIYTKDILGTLGISIASSLDESCEQIESNNFSYLDIEYLSPKLHHIIELRPFLGLRSPVHTIARMINPFNARYSMIGIFHPGYQPVHQLAAQILKQPHLAVVKGDGGEIERNPDMDCVVQTVHGDSMADETWPAMFKRRHIRDDKLDTDRLIKLWRGETEEEYGTAAVVGTLAITLKMMGKANTMSDAEQLATKIWNDRSKDKYGTAA